MTDLISRIAAAIVRQEGMRFDHTNPGNLRDAPWFGGQPPVLVSPAGDDPQTRVVSRRKHPDGSPVLYELRGKAGVFWVPATRAEGEAAIQHCLWLRAAERQSLRQIISAWAPPSDNNATEAYITNVKTWAAIADENVPLLTYLGASPLSAKIPT